MQRYPNRRQKQIHKQNIENEWPFIVLFSYWRCKYLKYEDYLKVMRPKNVFFHILRGCFISKIVLNLSFRWVNYKKLYLKN